MPTQLVSRPMRRKLVDRFVRFPKPRTGQPRKSDPHDHRLPSEARMSPCLSLTEMAGVTLPTGNHSLPRPQESLKDAVISEAMPTATKTIAATITLVLTLIRAINLRTDLMNYRTGVDTLQQYADCHHLGTTETQTRFTRQSLQSMGVCLKGWPLSWTKRPGPVRRRFE